MRKRLQQLTSRSLRGRVLTLALLLYACVWSSAGVASAKAAPKTVKASPVAAKQASKRQAKQAQPKVRGKQTKPAARTTPARRTAVPKTEAVPMHEIPAELRALGPLSVGHPSAGYLINSVPMPASPYWVQTAPDHGFATQETIDGLSHCLTQVHEQFPNTEPTRLGSISGVRGGRISPHKSHRTGRDADVYFFRKPGARWVRAATEADIDLAPTWALLRCFITDTDVDMILLDRRVQGWLEAYALAHGESKAWVRTLFHDQKEPRQMAVVRHEPGHVAHMHVRFSSPKARRAAVAAYDRLVAAGLVVPKVQSLSHQVKQGETLSGIAQKFGVPVEKIKSLNQLHSNLIRVGQVLTLQQAVDILGARDPVGIPARRRPPSDAAAPAAKEPGRVAAKSPSNALGSPVSARTAPAASEARVEPSNADAQVPASTPVTPARLPQSPAVPEAAPAKVAPQRLSQESAS